MFYFPGLQNLLLAFTRAPSTAQFYDASMSLTRKAEGKPIVYRCGRQRRRAGVAGVGEIGRQMLGERNRSDSRSCTMGMGDMNHDMLTASAIVAYKE